jgi:hypothetical protein
LDLSRGVLGPAGRGAAAVPPLNAYNATVAVAILMAVVLLLWLVMR